MAGVRTTNTTDFSSLAAGVFITEIPPPAVVVGAQQTRSLIVGECVKGPVDKAVEIRSPTQLSNIFGARDIVTGGPFAGHVWRALLNKLSGVLTIVRAAAADAVAATVNLLDTATPVVRVDAANVGSWGNGVSATVSDATDGVADHFDMTVSWRANETGAGGQTQRFTNLDVSATGNNNLAVRVPTGDSVLVVVSKLADGRPDNGTFPLLTGSDGTITDTDFTATGRALDVASTAQGIGQRHVAGRSNTVIKTAVATKAGLATTGFWLVGPDDESVAMTAAIADVGTLSRSDRLEYCFGHTLTLDPDTGNLVVQEPMDVKSNNLSRLPVHLGTGISDVGAFNVGIASFADVAQTSLADTDYDVAFVAGITALERDADNGFVWRDQVTTFLQDGTDRFVEPRRRQVDFLLQNVGRLAKQDVNEPNSALARQRRAGAASAFLRSLMKSQIIVDRAEDGKSDGFSYDTESGNDPAQKALGIQKDLMRVRRIPEARIIHLVSEIGTTVTILVGADGSATEA